MTARLPLVGDWRLQFSRQLHLWGVLVPKQETQAAIKLVRANILSIPLIRNVTDDEQNPANRVIILNESVKDAGLSSLGDVAQQVFARGWTTKPCVAQLHYQHFTAEQVLRELLPAGVEVPSSFETVGHIAHLNLRADMLPHKALVGQVLLDKNLPTIRTIVNKVGTIESEFRVPSFELLAGEPGLETEVRQHGAVFKLDFGEVYWNSRLEQEHSRLVALLQPGEVLCDMMAGVGPFAVPAARRGHSVYANDLNPRCAHFLRVNAALNKVAAKVRVCNQDARAFLRALAAGTLEAEGAPPPPPGARTLFHHVVMNLPASAVLFLDSFKGAFRARCGWSAANLPTVHCYAFLRRAETQEELKRRAEEALGGPIPEASEWKVHIVRDVAPNKEMVCLSFKLPPAIAFYGEEEEEAGGKAEEGDGSSGEARRRERAAAAEELQSAKKAKT